MRFIVLLSTILALLSNMARADAPQPDPTTEQVRKLFRDGTTHYNLGEYKEALEKYKSAYRLKPDPAFLFNLGQCYRQLGDMAGAVRSYRAYLRETPEAPNRLEVERLIKAAEQAVAARSQAPTDPRAPSGMSAGPVRRTPRSSSSARAEVPSPATAAADGEGPTPSDARMPKPDGAVPTSASPARTSRWVWPVVGIAVLVVAGAAVGLGVGLSHDGAPGSTLGVGEVRF